MVYFHKKDPVKKNKDRDAHSRQVPEIDNRSEKRRQKTKDAQNPYDDNNNRTVSFKNFFQHKNYLY